MNSKKEKIIEAACTTLIREGSSNFSMRKVADELSMSLGNLQYHFKMFIYDNKKGREVLEQIADSPCSAEAIYRGSAFLLPYIEGYG